MCRFLHSEQNHLDTSDTDTISKYHSKSILRKHEANGEQLWKLKHLETFYNRLLETTD